MTKYIGLLILILGWVSLGTVAIESTSDSLRFRFVSKATTQQVAPRLLVDSLANAARTDEELIEAYSIAAESYIFVGKIDSAILYSDKAATIARSIFHTSWQIKSSLLIARIYREVGLYSYARKYMDEAQDLHKKQQKSADYPLLRVQLLQEKTQHAFEQQAYEAGMKHLRESVRLSPEVKAQEATIRLIFATNDYLLGRYHQQHGQLEQADSLYATALEQLGNRFGHKKAYLYAAHADLALQAHEFGRAKMCLDSATVLLLPQTVSKLKLDLLESKATYYWNTGDFIQAREYESLATTLKEELSERSKTISDDMLYEMSISQDALSNQNLVIVLVNISLLALLIIVFIYLFIMRKPKARESLPAHQESASCREETAHATSSTPKIAKTAETKTSCTPLLRDEPGGMVHEEAPGSETTSTEQHTDSDLADVQIATETEDRLLEKLIEQEAQHFYLRKRLTRASVAKLMGTNQRYISYIIRKHRGSDFHTYLQTYRVQYILERLNTEEQLWEQKIATLASLAGFIDQGKFSLAFKAATGLSPSAYINKKKNEASSEPMY